MPGSFQGIVELVGGPLDGQECAVFLPEEEKNYLFFDAGMYPLPVNIFPSQICSGMILLEYRWNRINNGTAYYRYVDKKHIL